MKSFLEDVVDQVLSQEHDLGKLCFILPSRRAGVYVKEHLFNKISQTTFIPEILSIESFVESISGLKTVSNTVLLFELYSVYCSVTPKKEQDSFASFSSWAPAVIQDINEVDRFLIPQQEIFSYLSEIQDLNHWSLEKEQTPFVKKYLSFWKTLPALYQQFSNQLLSKGHATQGLCFREAYENIEHYIQSTPNRHHIFAGFNALNKAEQGIIEELLQHHRAEIYWDIDSQFLSDESHAAGHFIRKYKKEWAQYKKDPFLWEHSHFSSPKNIQIIGTPKNVGQAKQVGSLLTQFSDQNVDLSKTAVVLGNESLLQPTLFSIPESIPAINVTMGLSLNSASLATFFNQLISLHADKHDKGFYYKNVQHLLSHQNIRSFLVKDKTDEVVRFTKRLHKENVVYIHQTYLEAHFSQKHHQLIKLLFANQQHPIQMIKCLQELVQWLKSNWLRDSQTYQLELEQLKLFNEIFNQLSTLVSTYPFIDDLKTLQIFYKDLLSTQTLNFQGEPLEGLQLMGMLETRAIDFETVIITSVNEGVLPAGKQPPTTIPFDVKKQFGLPTFEEKDAIYTYHFYRLLQRANNIYLIYNNASEGLNASEKSRFLYQLEMNALPQHKVTSLFATPSISIEQPLPKVISKTPGIMMRLKEMAERGFSPSSLNQYIKNPIAFFEQRVMGIQELTSVEESPEAATFGTIVHEVLEILYTPFVGKNLSETELLKKLKELPKTIQQVFLKHYPLEAYQRGKNRVIYEVINYQINQFINAEIDDLNNGATIKIIALEQQISSECTIEELEFPVRFSGIVDRIDQRDGILRIIDYKTSAVKAGELTMLDFENITNDEKYSKALQVLIYGTMWKHQKDSQPPFEAGVISFKNLAEGFLRFGIKEVSRPKSPPKDYLISSELIETFETRVKELLLEIFDSKKPFIEKSI